MTLTTLALLLLSQQVESAKPGLEILEEGLPKGNLYVSCVSRSGLTMLVNNGRDVVLVQGDRIAKLPNLTMGMFFPLSVRDDGLIAGESPKAERFKSSLLYRDGQFRRLADEVGPGIGPASGFGASGLVYIHRSESKRIASDQVEETHSVIAFGDSDPVEVHSSSGALLPVGPLFARAVDETPYGLLGEVWWPVSNARQRLPQARYLDGVFVHGFAAYVKERMVTRFEIPRKTDTSGIEAWSDDGATVAGYASPPVVPVIWREGRILEALYIKGVPANAWFKALTKKGDMAVGCRILGGKPDLALVWREGKGLCTVAELAAEKKVVIPEGWRLTNALGVTSSGETITGEAVNEKDKRVRPFRLTLTVKNKGAEGGQSKEGKR